MTDVYLDNHSATRLDRRVLDAMRPFLEEDYGNPQNMHEPGNRSLAAMEQARCQVAGLIGAGAGEICFTSCACESNNLAVKGVMHGPRDRGRHAVVSSIEHLSIMHAARRLESTGFEVTYLPVDSHGLVSPDDVKKAIRRDTVIVSIQHASSEIGTVQPIEEISRVVHEQGALLHCDATATCGLVPVSVGELGVDLLTLDGSLFHGPKGGAALYVRAGVELAPLIEGGVQENGWRAGNENIPAIVGLGQACRIAQDEREGNRRQMTALRDRLINFAEQKIEHIYLNGHRLQRLPNNINYSVEFIEGEAMLLLLNQKGIYATTSSACASKMLKISHVLTATKVNPAIGHGSLLMTLSKYNTDQDIEYVLAELPPIVKRLRDMSPLWAHFVKTGERIAAGPGTDYEHSHEAKEE